MYRCTGSVKRELESTHGAIRWMSKFSAFTDLGKDLEELTSSTTSRRLSWSSNDKSSPNQTDGAAPEDNVFSGIMGSEIAPSTPSRQVGEIGRSTPMSARTDDTTDSMLSLTDINDELHEIIGKVNKGEKFDEKRLDYLIARQNDHPEHQINMERENQEWLASIQDFLAESLAKTRSFLPINVSELGSKEKVIESSGVSEEVAKRVLEKKCLWLCRMAPTEINKIHIVDLSNKYNPLGVNLDIIETAAVFACLPVTFQSDSDGKKAVFRDDIMQTLKDMLSDKDTGRLTQVRSRHPCYESCSGDDEYGPVDDITSTLVNRRASIRSADFDTKPRRSFTEVCKRHSILSKHREVSTELDKEDSDNGDDSGDGDDQNERRRAETENNTETNRSSPSSSSSSSSSSPKKNNNTKTSENIYVVYSGEDLVYFGWMRREVKNEVTNTAAFVDFFVVCTRNDAYLRLFKNEADVEEVGVVNLNLVLKCEKTDVSNANGTSKGKEEDGDGSNNTDLSFSTARDSGGDANALYVSGGGDVHDEEKEGKTKEGKNVHRFVLQEVSGKEHIFECDDAQERDVWVGKLTPVLKAGEQL